MTVTLVRAEDGRSQLVPRSALTEQDEEERRADDAMTTPTGRSPRSARRGGRPGARPRRSPKSARPGWCARPDKQPDDMRDDQADETVRPVMATPRPSRSRRGRGGSSVRGQRPPRGGCRVIAEQQPVERTCTQSDGGATCRMSGAVTRDGPTMRREATEEEREDRPQVRAGHVHGHREEAPRGSSPRHSRSRRRR